MQLSVALLLLPLLADARSHPKRCKAIGPTDSNLSPLALVATGRGGHHWGQSLTSSAPEAGPTSYTEEGEEDNSAGEEEEEYSANAEDTPPEEPYVPGDEDVDGTEEYIPSESVAVSHPAYAPSGVHAPPASAPLGQPGGYATPSADPPPVQSVSAGPPPIHATQPVASSAAYGPVPSGAADGSAAPSSAYTPVSSVPVAPPASTGASVPATNESCECGYIVSSHDNAYFPSAIIVDFSTMSDLSQLAELGLEISDGWKVGSVNDADGTTCEGTASNVRLNGGILELVVPGGQRGGVITGAEVQTTQAVMGGIFTVNAQLDPGHGTCQAIFTYTADEAVGRDEQDIEMLGQSLLTQSDTGVEPGIQLTNWSPDSPGTNDFGIVPFSADPTTAFHDYTVAWIPGGTKYYFDGTVLAGGPTQFSSVNPSKVVINNWSNGDQTFTQGPPISDVVMKVKSLTYYYQVDSLGNYPAYPAGCTQADACVV